MCGLLLSLGRELYSSPCAVTDEKGNGDSVFRQPCQCFLAGLKNNKFAAREVIKVLSEHAGKVLRSHPCGFLDMGFVKDGSLFHDPNGLLVKGCSREIG